MGLFYYWDNKKKDVSSIRLKIYSSRNTIIIFKLLQIHNFRNIKNCCYILNFVYIHIVYIRMHTYL